MKRDVFYVIILTVFAVLFMLTYFSYRDLAVKLTRMEKTLKAYELYIFSDYENFEDYVKKEGLKIEGMELLKEKKARSLIAEGKNLFETANYGEALVFFEKALNLSDNEEIKKIASFYLEECRKKLAGD
ncbi:MULTISPECIES: hypothetical protein [unclassified Thermotoga]|uniref:TM1634 family protein n=1 Tax=unclassified Thermotoga TaxID=2631113 RepID=UPI000542D3F8|nr:MULTISPECIES: hypothetical protein [unclassified Thermotoga]KAF2960467.1 hypothetical protein AS158_02070 [Thermotoga sp. 38H-to]KHC91898.1 hypothetical protein Mc24_03983 [Thermotoga sp. Mc24]